MLYVLLRSWVVRQFGQSIMPKFSMQLVLLTFILIFREFSTKLSGVVD